MVGALIVVGLCAVAQPAAAQANCSFSTSGADYSTHFYPAVDAQTWETGGSGCGVFSVQTEAWILGTPSARCILGNPSTWFQLNGGNDRTTHLSPGFCRGTNPWGECDEWEMYDEEYDECIAYNTPIIIPLTKSQAIKLTDVAGGVGFDFDGDGSVERTAWTAAESRLAFLAIDRNGNGIIDNGTELFGDHTVPGAKLGFDALRMLNEQMGGTDPTLIDSTQPIYSKLLLWEDSNHNGVSEPTELQPASNIVTDIGLGLIPTNRKDGFGNLLGFRGFAHVRTAPGQNRPRGADEDRERQIAIYDVFFVKK